VLIKLFTPFAVRNVEAMLEDLKIIPFSNSYYQSALYTRVWGEFQRILIILVKDDPDHQKINLFYRMTFIDEDFSQESFRSEITEYQFSYSSLKDNFGIQADLLEFDDKHIIFKLLVDTLTIKKKKAKRGKEEDSQIQEDPIEIFNNLILKSSLPTVVAFKTVYLGGTYRFPSNIRLIGLNGVPVGLSVTQYDPETSSEKYIMFLLVHSRRPFPYSRHLEERHQDPVLRSQRVQRTRRDQKQVLHH
jgi:hypothetical protein